MNLTQAQLDTLRTLATLERANGGGYQRLTNTSVAQSLVRKGLLTTALVKAPTWKGGGGKVRRYAFTDAGNRVAALHENAAVTERSK